MPPETGRRIRHSAERATTRWGIRVSTCQRGNDALVADGHARREGARFTAMAEWSGPSGTCLGVTAIRLGLRRLARQGLGSLRSGPPGTALVARELECGVFAPLSGPSTAIADGTGRRVRAPTTPALLPGW